MLTRGTNLRRIDVYDLARELATVRASTLSAVSRDPQVVAELLTEVAVDVLREPGDVLQRYLRNMADAYTLLAFMRETPDVRRALQHLYGRARLILDTSVLLPCLAEVLLPETDRLVTLLLRAAAGAGARLEVVPGVINEIHAHINIASRCQTTSADRWQGRVPFLLVEWRRLAVGGSFRRFVETFEGTEAPMDDIQDFLATQLGVTVADDVWNAASEVDIEIRGRLTEVWRDRRERWRHTRSPFDDTNILLRHDVDTYLGVSALRHGRRDGLYGYDLWWVTRDATAFALRRLMQAEQIELGPIPCMHPDFLSNFLALEPLREPDIRQRLPVAVDVQYFAGQDVVATADTIRRDNEGLPEYLVRRRIRDALDRERARQPDGQEVGVRGQEDLGISSA